MACVDSLTGFAYHEGPAAVRDYADLFEHLVDVALDAAGSAAIIHDNREQLR
jgi:hypothetical protein